MINKFLHYGFRVNNLDEAVKLYEHMGFTVKNKFDKPEPNAKAAQLSSESGVGIELWEFIDNNHPQVEFISSHIAFESDDFESDIKGLVQKGCELVIPITQGVTRIYAFLCDPSGNYIEVCKK